MSFNVGTYLHEVEKTTKYRNYPDHSTTIIPIQIKIETSNEKIPTGSSKSFQSRYMSKIHNIRMSSVGTLNTTTQTIFLYVLEEQLLG